MVSQRPAERHRSSPERRPSSARPSPARQDVRGARPTDPHRRRSSRRPPAVDAPSAKRQSPNTPSSRSTRIPAADNVRPLRPVATSAPKAESKAKRQPSRKRPAETSVWKAGRPTRRLVIAFAGVAVALSVVVARIGNLQLSEPDLYVAAGEQQRTRDVVLTAERGSVLDRNGAELAMSVSATTFWANPKKIINPGSTAAAIGSLLGLDTERVASIAEDLAKTDKSFVYVARQVDDSSAEAIKSLRLPGIGWNDEPTRIRPSGDVARSIIGRTDIDGVGIGGIEQQFDAELNGKPGRSITETDNQGRSIPSGKRIIEEPVPGSDVVLTIDQGIQYLAERAVTAKVEELQARGGVVIVEDTKTGEILAMASVRRNDEDAVVVSPANIAVVDAYEPGSVAKIITVAAALNDGTVSANTYFDVPSWKVFYDTTLHDAEPHPVESMSVARILAKSSNIGTIFIGQTLSLARQSEYLHNFGLGGRSALGFPGESKGILRPYDKWQGTEKVTISYGQGIAATPIQLIGAVNTIANGGNYVDPKLVKSTIDRFGTEVPSPPSLTRTVVDLNTAQVMNTLMRDVVCAGTASQAKVPGYTVAGKTGTGYKAQPNGGYIRPDGTKSYYSSFVGFLPAEDPQITVLVSIDEPPASGNHFGGNTAAPVFAQLAAEVASRLDIAPSPNMGEC